MQMNGIHIGRIVFRFRQNFLTLLFHGRVAPKDEGRFVLIDLDSRFSTVITSKKFRAK
jgi:hypothetical protein